MRKHTYPSNGRLCVHFPTLIPSVPQKLIDMYLERKGYKKLSVDVIALAREQLGKPYLRGSVYSEELRAFDCSSLMQWLYGQKGVYIPRISIDQRDSGIPIAVENIQPGDLVFTKGYIDYYWDDDKDNGVGHVGIYTGDSVIHATNKERGVAEDELEHFLEGNFRGITRMHDNILAGETLLIPETEHIEYDTHLRWKILRSLQ